MRCAVYTRKSIKDEASVLVSSIEAQRDLCEKYIASQVGSDWACLATRYDDLGQGGGSLDRPALARLIGDVREGHIDVIVVYKIDRLSRSLKDFVVLIDLFDRIGVTFFSVSQQFSTTTSLGRLTLNILLSFAQFERELIGERTRDWVAAARRRGLWTSGPPPYGYDSNAGRLVVHPERAKIVRFVFRRFEKNQCFLDIARELNSQGKRNRRGAPFNGRLIKAILRNRAYRGDLVGRGGTIKNTHSPLVTEQRWRRTQALLDEHAAAAHRRSASRPRPQRRRQ